MLGLNIAADVSRDGEVREAIANGETNENCGRNDP